jgi:transposase InsO family protein
MSKRYTEAFKREISEQYTKGTSAPILCAQYGMARSTLFSWVQQYTANEVGQMPREQYLMVKELERLRTENKIYKVCGCSPSSPLSDRIAAITAHQTEFSIHALCRVLQVNRSTYYYHALRAPEQTQLQMEDAALKPLIVEIFEKSEGRFGARKIRVKLLQEGYTVSERRILRLMKELKLSAKGKHPKLNSANDRQYQYYPNKLKRNFLTDAPNKIWVSDITYAKVGMDFLYLCVIIDLYSRKVIGYGISENIDADLVIKTFTEAFSIRGTPSQLIFHSDQGAQYTAYEFRMLLKRNGVTQSFSAPGTPYDNAVAESFFANIKKEDFRRNFYKTQAEFQEAVERYIAFYNDYRPHQRLGFLTPNQVEDEYNATHTM